MLANLTERAWLSDCEQDVIQEALSTVRRHLGMDVAYFSEFVDGRSIFRRVDAPGLEHLVKVGDSQSLDDVYCNHILQGRLPELMPDTTKEPLALSMPITAAVPIGSHVSIPVLLPDGQPFGMFCCLSPKANPTLNTRDLDTMRIFAGLATRQLHAQVENRQAGQQKHRAVSSVVADNDLDIVFQPIVDLKTTKTVSLEALSRFRKPPYRSPDKWFADAAEVGLGVELELTAIKAALASLDVIPASISLSINASPTTLLDARLPLLIEEQNWGRIVIELTEHARVDDYDLLHGSLNVMRERGLSLAIDDAGAGYSGLQHIVRMRPDIIKMDMSLTRGIDSSPALRALGTAMIFYARETGALIVAEGIETAEELQALETLGVSRGQGYLFGKPAPLSSVVADSKIQGLFRT